MFTNPGVAHYINTKYNKFFYFNESNYININISDNYCIASSIYFPILTSSNVILNMVKTFYDDLKITYDNVNYVATSGTASPLLIKTIALANIDYGANYEIVYNNQLVSDKNSFLNEIIYPLCENVDNVSCAAASASLMGKCSFVINIRRTNDMVIPEFLLPS
jgi:hypothetical protein